MQIRANMRLCDGFANCVAAAPDLFDLNDDDKVIVLKHEVNGTERSRVEEAIRSCPVSALSIGDA
jgi:3-phenylpropionate/trans-cinnamate dioxygenase ferredoxin reductase subunit